MYSDVWCLNSRTYFSTFCNSFDSGVLNFQSNSVKLTSFQILDDMKLFHFYILILNEINIEYNVPPVLKSPKVQLIN